eukprot:Em0003g814a
MELQASTPSPSPSPPATHVVSSPVNNVKNLARRFEHSAFTHHHQQQGTACLPRPGRQSQNSGASSSSSSSARKLGRLRSRSLSPTVRRLSDATSSIDHYHQHTTSSPLVPPHSPSPLLPPVPRLRVEAGGNEDDSGGVGDELGALKAELIEAKKVAATLTGEVKHKEQEMKLLHKKLEDSRASRAGRGLLKQWVNWQPSNSSNVLRKLPRHDVVEDPEEIVHLFIQSEQIYVDSLHALEFFYHEPLKTLSIFKPDMLGYTQLGALFLNCSELLVVHRFLLQELSQIPSLPMSIQVDELLTTLERFFPSFSLYGPHLASGRDQSLQKEYRTCLQRPQFKQLLDHCQNKCGGRGLLEFLSLPSERLNDYVSLLSHFFGAHMRNLSDACIKRAEILVSYLNKLKYGFQEQHSESERALEKTKLLQKLAPEAPVPVEMFEADVELVKQGPLTMTYFAIADRLSGSGEGVHLRVLEYGMIPLGTAQLHKCVDVEGQTMQPDLQSGLGEDRMGFRISFKNKESLFFRVAKPNERRVWVEALDKCIQDSHPANHSQDETDHVSFSPEVGPKIAAASMEKLLKQLISPHMFRDDFMEVFLMTHSCFTSSKNVLTALINCINSPGDTTTESSNPMAETSIFTFSDLSDSVTSISITDVAMSPSHHFMCASESENESPSASPSLTRRILPLAPSHDPKGEVALAVGRGVASTTSTSDSDVSPHTSAIVVDNGAHHEPGTQNGWQSSEVFMRGEEHSLYVSLCPRDFRKASHSSDHHSWGDTEDSDAVDGEEEEERGGGEDNLPTPCNSAKTLKLEDLHEDSELLAPPLNARVSSRGKSADTELDGDQDASLSNALSAQTSAVVYTSEPNLTVLGIHRDKATPSYPAPSSPSKQVPEGPVHPTMSLNVTTPPTSSRTQHFHHGMAMTAPAGGLQYEYKLERGRGAVGLRKSATMEKKPRRGGGGTAATAEVGGVTVVGKHRKGFKEQFLSKLNKMRGKKEGKTTSSVPDILMPPGGQSKARRSSILKRYPSSASGVTESLGGGVALQATESPFPSSGRTGSFSSSVGGASQYSTLVSKIFSVLNCWQEWHYEDFERDEELKSMLHEFLSSILTRNHSDTHLYRQAKHLMDLIKVKEPVIKDGNLPSLLVRVTCLNPTDIAMYDWSSTREAEAPGASGPAQQASGTEGGAVERYELLNCNWKKGDKDRLAPNVCRLIRRTNELTSWVCTEVLSRDTPQARANVIELFIDVAKCCYGHKDFHCSLNITIALKSSAVRGLAKTWALVDKKSRQRLERLSKLTDYNGRCKKLRETLEQLTEDSLEKNETLPSALPYLGAYLDQIYTLEMSSKTFNPDQLVNFTKMTKLADLVRTALQYQESTFPFEPQLDIMAYVMSAKRLSENELYDLSMKLEPRS